MEMKMKSMKRSAADRRKGMGEVAAPTSIAPDYPYGLVMHLDSDEMDKLGLKMPKPGDVLMIEAKVKCTACRMSAVEGADEENNCDLQITDMMISTSDDEKD